MKSDIQPIPLSSQELVGTLMFVGDLVINGEEMTGCSICIERAALIASPALPMYERVVMIPEKRYQEMQSVIQEKATPVAEDTHLRKMVVKKVDTFYPQSGGWESRVTFWGWTNDHEDPTLTIKSGQGIANPPKAGQVLLVSPPQVVGEAVPPSSHPDAQEKPQVKWVNKQGKHDFSQCEKMVDAEKNALLARLDGYRSSYFIPWALALWIADKKRLQDFSVAELIEKYHLEIQSNGGPIVSKKPTSL